MNCLEIMDASPALHLFIKRLINSNHINDPEYHLRTKCHAFFQGGSINTQGWILIEFWSQNMDAIQEFVDYINTNAPEQGD